MSPKRQHRLLSLEGCVVEISILMRKLHLLPCTLYFEWEGDLNGKATPEFDNKVEFVSVRWLVQPHFTCR